LLEQQSWCTVLQDAEIAATPLLHGYTPKSQLLDIQVVAAVGTASCAYKRSGKHAQETVAGKPIVLPRPAMVQVKVRKPSSQQSQAAANHT
jgi:hypothetical protein